MSEPREFYINDHSTRTYDSYEEAFDFEGEESDIVHVVEKSAFDKQAEKIKKLEAVINLYKNKMHLMVDTHKYALLEFSAWMGIPEDKRLQKIKYSLEDSEYVLSETLKEIKEILKEKDGVV